MPAAAENQEEICCQCLPYILFGYCEPVCYIFGNTVATATAFFILILQPLAALGKAANLRTNYCLFEYMTGHLRIKSPRSQLGLFLGLFGLCYIFTGSILVLICNANNVPLNPAAINWNDPHTLMILKLNQGLSSVLIFMLPAIAFSVMAWQGSYFEFLGFKPAEKSPMYVLAILGILLALPVVAWLGKFNDQIPLPEVLKKIESDTNNQIQAFLKINHSYDLLLNVFIMAFLPAVCEEMCFRGVLQRICIQWVKRPWAGIIITAFLFSALHMQFQGFLPRMFLGVLLGAFYWYSGSLWTCILAHFANNGLQVVMASYMPKYIKENPDAPILAGVVCAAVVLVILWYYKKLSTVSYAKVYQEETDNYQHP